MRAAVLLGASRDDVRRDQMATLRQRAVAWLTGLTGDVTERSSTGKPRDRALAVATCGRPTPVLWSGDVYLSGRQCRDRACPRCAAAKSRETTYELRAAVDARRSSVGRSLWYVTLTQPKPFGSNPAEALASLMAGWRRATNTKTRRGRRFRVWCTGAVRTVELTWSPEGATRHDGSTVACDGWHAHVHVMLEGGSRSQVSAFVNEWCDDMGAQRAAQDIQVVDKGCIYQLCKYVSKPLAKDVPVSMCRRLYKLVHGRRLQEALGEWRGWRKWLPKPDADPVVFADVTAAEVVSYYGHSATRDDEEVVFVRVDEHAGGQVSYEETRLTPRQVVARCRGWLPRERGGTMDGDESSGPYRERPPPTAVLGLGTVDARGSSHP